MAKQVIAGIGVYETFASLAVIEADNDILELKHLEEIPARSTPFWYLDLLGTVDTKIASRMKKIAFSFNADPVYIHSFPAEPDLNPGEQDNQARWELAQILPGYSEEIFPSKVIPMQPMVGETVQDVVAIAMDSGRLSALEEALRDRKFRIGPVMAEMSAIDRALYLSHPEEMGKRSACLHIGTDRVELVRYLAGEISGYHAERSADPDELMRIVELAMAADPADMLYAYGTGLTPGWTRMLRNAFGQQFMPLNPFRRLRITASVHNFSRFLGKEHRFPASVGAALSS